MWFINDMSSFICFLFVLGFFLCVFASRLTRIDTSPFTDEVPQNQRLLNKSGLNFVCIFLRSPALEGGFPKKLKGMQ